MSDEPISRDILDAVGNYTRFHILSEINRAFIHSGLTIEQLASRLEWSPRKVRRFLSGKTEMDVDFLGELAFGIDGSLIKVSIDPKS